LTLKFLGDTEIAKLDLVGDQLEELAAVHAPLVIQLDKLGCFPNHRKPRVVWVGVNGGSTLQDIQRAVEDNLAPLGWPVESRKYHPHLTLGRVKNPQQVVTARYPWGKQLVTGRQRANEICLIESDLQPSGPVYTVRRRARLGGESPESP
jgi:2'-5' RNA ligase